MPDGTEWIKLNKNQFGYYRVNYHMDGWKSLSVALKDVTDKFTIEDRANLLNDAFSLAEAKQLDYEVPLNLTEYVWRETQHAPWKVVSAKLSGIRKLLHQTGNDSKFLVS